MEVLLLLLYLKHWSGFEASPNGSFVETASQQEVDASIVDGK